MHSHTASSLPTLLLVGALTVFGAGCSGGSGNPPGFETAGGDFLPVRAAPSGGSVARLNDPITVDFTTPIDIASADLNSIQFQVFDINGAPLQEQVTGEFSIGTATGDDEPGRRLVFTPNFPTNDTYTNGGVRPARRYSVTLPAGNSSAATVLVDQRGRRLERAFSFDFRTPNSTLIAELFRDQGFGGPQVEDVIVSPRDATSGRVLLNEFSAGDVEVTVQFDQPLDPATANLPLAISSDPVVRATQEVGRVFLQYTDPVDGEVVVPATVDLEANTNDGAALVLRPVGLLPNNAEIEVVVEPRLRDLSGQSNFGNPLYQRVVQTFTTVTDFEPQFDAVVEDFATSEFVDFGANFLEPRAEVVAGRIRSSFAFEGNERIRTYRPLVQEVFLNTSFTQVTPEGGPPFNVFGGEFRFAEVEIPIGVTVQATGPNPMTWLVNGDFTVNGTLSVDGGDGQRVDSLNSPNTATGGGTGQAGGGNGGLGSPNTDRRTLVGQNGFGPFQTPGGGGRGGLTGCGSANCGSGGGGGSFSTQGDPFYPPTGQQWGEVFGDGGGSLPGGATDPCTPGSLGGPGGTSAIRGLAGPLAFTDARIDNDFFGTGVNIARGVRVEGELLAPRGGSGGGGGGDRAVTAGGQCVETTQFFSTTGSQPNNGDQKGGGGGGGGGVLIVKALGAITIGPNGRISAEGGDGGGGEDAGTSELGGGGGAGSGGMIVLISGERIDIVRRSTQRYGGGLGSNEERYDFAISADGGVCRRGEFSDRVTINGKYNPLGTVNTFDPGLEGGFGGLGLVQLQVPPGNDSDGTNNRLDDRIRLLNPDLTDLLGNPLPHTTQDKLDLLGWRGWPVTPTIRTGTTATIGTGEDDAGNIIARGRNDGTIRPAPILLPATFGPLSRARSKWIDLGAARRRPLLTPPTGLDPRVVVSPASEVPSPDFEFAGTVTTGDPNRLGFAEFSVVGATANQQFPTRASAGVASIEQGLVEDGVPAFAVNLVAGALAGTEDDRFIGFRLELEDETGNPLADFRILSHSGDRVVCASELVFPSEPIVRANVLAKFFQVLVDNQPTLGPTLSNGGAAAEPFANVRIGFAFTTDPSDPMAPRWPADSLESFEFDLDVDSNPGLRTFLETNRPAFIRWDVLFDRTFATGSAPLLSADLPFPEIDYLVVPYRY